uniref:Acyl-coenzyme A oxidase N-terminal domain-containing protein n=1 Tax=Plectus sambesii TaxID=2011161 RepID=A0A914UL59_9BILA
MAEHGPAINVLDYETGHHFSNLIMARDSHPFELHYGMFLPTLRGQGTDEQQEKWIPLALIRAIVGTYAQTELGHGTNLRKLEVTSTYDPKTQEFVLHSPTVTATKWWPGGLGKTSNYAIVVAQLWTLGKCYGPHPFLVQLRDLETHQPLPGIKLGDIGPKLGFNANDNGFLIFDHLRIPRDQMLMRHAQVLPNGEYVKPAHSKLGYGTMVYVRSMMIGDQGLQLGIAATIAIRYSAIRRQGEMVEGQGEVKVLDYQTQQYRIFPQMAKAYAYIFASTKVRDMYTKNMKLMKSGNVSLLPELHALSSGLKAVVTWEVAQGIEQCRLACGGHGFSQASGFPELYAQTVAGCTYEGENIVLLLQVSKFLVKAARQVRSGEAALLAEVAEYLGVVGANRSTFSQSQNFSDKIVIEAFEHVARRLVFSALDKLDHLRGEGVGPEEAWNRTSVELCKA